MAEAPIAIKELLRNKPNRVLDIGSGTGSYLHLLRDLNVPGVGLDLSEGMLRIAREKLGSAYPLVQGDARQLPFEARAFPAILMARVLSHIFEVEQALSEVSRVLRSTGTFVLTDIHPDHAYETTHLPIEDKKVSVETYKHHIDAILSTAWRVAKLREVSTQLVRRSPVRPEVHVAASSHPSLSDPPIGYIVAFRRT